jgi:hypothetical protein
MYLAAAVIIGISFPFMLLVDVNVVRHSPPVWHPGTGNAQILYR